MILAAGLSPAWQQILVFDKFRPGEVNRARSAQWCASGKVLNVGLALAHLDRTAVNDAHGCHVLSTLGGLARGPIDTEFSGLNVERIWVETSKSTRVCTTILDQASSTTTELVENAAEISPTEWSAFLGAYRQLVPQAQVAVLTGSLPPGAPATAYREMLDVTRCPAILDVRGLELLEALPARPLVVKPNLEELSRTFPELLDDSSADQDDPRRLVAMQLLREHGAQWVVVTQGARAVWVAGLPGVYRFQPPRITPVNPIGSGDTFAAGLAWSIAGGQDVLASVPFAIAAASANAEQLLPGRVDTKSIRKIARGIVGERIASN